MEPIKKPWRESASLLIAGQNSDQNPTQSNYKILVMERSDGSSYLPNITVFPGGALDKSDESLLWFDHYKSLNISMDKFDQLLDVSGPRPPIFQYKNKDLLPREIALRICAIRETFEEVGILICKNRSEFRHNGLFSTVASGFDVEFWQKEIHNDPTKFLYLCKELNVAPDLWSLHEWSVWLTPVWLIPKRYETAFFIVALKNQPNLLTEQSEVKKSSWHSVKHLMKLRALKKINLTSPQIYELSRLHNVNDIIYLANFAKERSPKGLQLTYPIVYMTHDTFVNILPGDDFYPDEPDLEKSPQNVQLYMDEQAEDFRKRAKNLHRIEFEGPSAKIYSNIHPACGHLPLLEMVEFSKL